MRIWDNENFLILLMAVQISIISLENRYFLIMLNMIKILVIAFLDVEKFRYLVMHQDISKIIFMAILIIVPDLEQFKYSLTRE